MSSRKSIPNASLSYYVASSFAKALAVFDSVEHWKAVLFRGFLFLTKTYDLLGCHFETTAPDPLKMMCLTVDRARKQSSQKDLQRFIVHISVCGKVAVTKPKQVSD